MKPRPVSLLPASLPFPTRHLRKPEPSQSTVLIYATYHRVFKVNCVAVMVITSLTFSLINHFLCLTSSLELLFQLKVQHTTTSKVL